jgi:cell division transport system permease protein
MTDPKHPERLEPMIDDDGGQVDAARHEKPLSKNNSGDEPALKKRNIRTPSLTSGRNIVPREGVAGQALLTVIAIMAFLACLTLGAVFLVRDTAQGWQTDISREVTVQIRPYENVDMEQSIRAASSLLLTFDGVEKVTVLDDEASARLLEPFLGSGLQLDELPIPALLTVSVDQSKTLDYAAIARTLSEEVPGASLDDHRSWVDRLNTMARTTVLGGVIVFILVMTATVLTVVFATRGAMAGNKDIVDVLHFVGADRVFIAREFEHHFLRLGLIGSLSGGIAAIFLFLALGVWSSTMKATPQADQMNALFGSFSIGGWGLFGIFLVAVGVAVLTGLTSRITVMRHVSQLETYGGRQKN